MKLNFKLTASTTTVLTLALLFVLMATPGECGQVLVRLKAGVSALRMVKAKKGEASKSLQVKRRFSHLFDKAHGELFLVEDPEKNSDELLREMKADPNVAQAALNYRRRILEVPDDPQYPEQWYMDHIDAPKAWGITTGSKGVVVMVVDSGIDPTHEDLIENLWTNPNDPPNGYDDDKNGYVDDTHGIDAIGKTGMLFDANGHGTHVAGIIGATGNNGKGISGTDWRVSIVGCRFIDATGYGSDSDAITCLDYAAALKREGVNLVAINSSWGGYQDNPLLESAIKKISLLGIALVAAAGNEQNNNDAASLYPASYNIPGVVSVASFNSGEHLSYFTNTGAGTVDLAAPGEQVLSTYPGLNYLPSSSDTFYDPCNSNWSEWDRTGTWQVTSESFHDGGMAWSDSPYGDYQDDANYSITSPVMNLSFAKGTCAVGFWAKTNLENGYDYLYVEASSDNTKWTTIGALTGTTLMWKPFSFYLPDGLESRTLRIRFRLKSDETIHYDGVYLDDIGINCGDYVGDEYKTLSGTSMATPFVTGTLALLASEYPQESVEELESRLLGGVQKRTEMSHKTASGGILNIYSALQADHMPLVTGVSPDSAAVGTEITITGVNFGTAEGRVWFETSDGSLKAEGEVSSWDDDEIVVKVPEGGGTYLQVEKHHGATSSRFLTSVAGLNMPAPRQPSVYQFNADAIPSKPKMGNDPATIVPFSLGDDSYSTMHLFVEMPKFDSPVDLYVAIEGIYWGTGESIFLITADPSGTWHTYNATDPVLYRYAENAQGPIGVKDLLAPGFPADQIPLDWGLNFFVVVVPAGSQDWLNYYTWWTSWY